jgi:hypothetical protein
MKKYLNDRLLVRSIEAHIRIINDGENVDLTSIGFEEGTPIDRVHDYNAFTILTKLNFDREEAVNPESESAKQLDALAAESNVETIIEKMVQYRDQIVNS